MKKFLLPLFVLALGGVASAQSSQQVTVSYWGSTGDYYDKGKPLFESTTNELVINGDDSYTLKNYQNSSFDFKFSISTKAFELTGYDKGKPERYPDGFLDGFLLTIPSKAYPEDASGDRYQYNLRTVDGFVIPSNQFTVPSTDLTGDVFINNSKCVAVPGEETAEAKKYTVYINGLIYFPKSVTGTYAIQQNTWSIFELTVPKEKEEEPDPEYPTGEYTVTYANFAQYNNTPYSATEKYDIAVVDENNIIFKNFLGSGFDIPFTFSAPTEVEGENYYATGTMSVAEECLLGKTGQYVRIKGKGQTTAITAKLPNDMTIADPEVYISGQFGGVKYYKEDGKVRRLIHFTIGLPYLTMEWNMIDGQNGDQSGIADVVVDGNAPVEWFNLQGVRVSGENLAPGVYIKRQGQKAVKVLVK